MKIRTVVACEGPGCLAESAAVVQTGSTAPRPDDFIIIDVRQCRADIGNVGGLHAFHSVECLTRWAVEHRG